MWNKDDWMWELSDGRVWSTSEARFVCADVAAAWLAGHPGMSAIPPSPVDEQGGRTVDGLRQALIFYGLPMGELATAEELFTQLRKARDAKIQATDYLIMPDYPLAPEKKAQIEAYRQALRDLPAREGAPWDGGGELTPWPEMPE